MLPDCISKIICEKINSIFTIKQVSYLIALSLMPLLIKSQFYNLPNDYFYNTITQKQLSKVDTEQLHLSIQPYIPFLIRSMNLLLILLEFLNI